MLTKHTSDIGRVKQLYFLQKFVRLDKIHFGLLGRWLNVGWLTGIPDFLGWSKCKVHLEMVGQNGLRSFRRVVKTVPFLYQHNTEK